MRWGSRSCEWIGWIIWDLDGDLLQVARILWVFGGHVMHLRAQRFS